MAFDFVVYLTYLSHCVVHGGVPPLSLTMTCIGVFYVTAGVDLTHQHSFVLSSC